jgi:hypothetical protein
LEKGIPCKLMVDLCVYAAVVDGGMEKKGRIRHACWTGFAALSERCRAGLDMSKRGPLYYAHWPSAQQPFTEAKEGSIVSVIVLF